MEAGGRGPLCRFECFIQEKQSIIHEATSSLQTQSQRSIYYSSSTPHVLSFLTNGLRVQFPFVRVNTARVRWMEMKGLKHSYS